MTTTLVEGPGWADHSVDRIRGLFPLAVERYLNGVVGELAPSVTTVTNVARTYCLHSLVMADAERDGLSVEGSRLLLRRAEVVLALASIAHSDEADHPSWMPDPHGRDRLLQAWQAGPLRLDEAADFYAQDRWGFRNPYVGSEIRLGILGRDGVSVGPGYIDTEVRSGLGEVLRVADQSTTLSMEDAKSLGKLCICGVRGSIDGAWLATRLVGDSGIPGSVAGVLASTMRLVAAALRHAEIRSERDVANFFAYSPVLNELSLESTPVAARWRGLTLRHRAVTSWRTLWAFLSHYARGAGGFVPLDEVQAWLADQAPDLTVRSFMATLPETMRGGFTQPAEPSCERLDLPEPISHLAQILLSGIRANELPPAVEWGYLGEPNDTDRAQELSPLWVARSIEQWQDRALRDYCLYIVRVLVDRSQRVALDKAGFRRGRFVLPARVLVRDGFLEWTDGEGALVPPLRLERLFHVGRQVSLFDTDGDGRWTIGERGDFLDSSY